MPAVGIIVPDGRKLSWDIYLKTDGPGIYPYPIRTSLHKAFMEERDRWVSASTIVYCLRKAKWEHDFDFFMNQKSAYNMFRGLIIHSILENVPNRSNNTLIETSLRCIVPGTNLYITGRLDRWENGILYDYKTISDNGIHVIRKEGPKAEHSLQTNIYRWMLEKNKNIQTKEIKIIYISMTNVLVTGEEYRINIRGLEVKGILQSCPMIPNDQLENFIIPKFKFLEEGHTPPASPAQWMCNLCPFANKCHQESGRGMTEVEMG